MGRPVNRLSARAVATAAKPGYYADGGGLYLQVAAGGSKSWIFRFQLRGKAREMGLGPQGIVTLAEARAAAVECRRKLIEGLDPIEERRRARQAAGEVLTFAQAQAKYIEAHAASWRNEKHKAQWKATLDTYAAKMAAMPVSAIDTAHVLEAIEPIWRTKTETATRVRQRIEAILDWAAARGMREQTNPARWRGHLAKLLPAPAKLKKVEHHAALHYSEIAQFMADLRARDTLSSRALQLQVLTATRSGEVVGAAWSEFDLQEGVWTIPAERMKAGREHRIPLSAQAQALLTAMPRLGTYLFPGGSGKPCMSTAALLKVAKGIRAGLTAHGARSTFRDWCGDCTTYPRDLAELALAHVVKDKTEAAYKRLDALERRRPMMQEWADHCDMTKGPIEAVRKSSSATGQNAQ